MSSSEDLRLSGSDVVAEAIAASKRATELRGEAIAQLLAQREQIDRDLKTLGHVESAVKNGNSSSPAHPIETTRTGQVTQQARATQFKASTLAQIGKLLLAEHGTLHGKDIEKLAKAGGFKGGTKNFQNYMPVAFKRAGGFENVGGNRWKLNDAVEPQK
jgi:hypothetical protein